MASSISYFHTQCSTCCSVIFSFSWLCISLCCNHLEMLGLLEVVLDLSEPVDFLAICCSSNCLACSNTCYNIHIHRDESVYTCSICTLGNTITIKVSELIVTLNVTIMKLHVKLKRAWCKPLILLTLSQVVNSGYCRDSSYSIPRPIMISTTFCFLFLTVPGKKTQSSKLIVCTNE